MSEPHAAISEEVRNLVARLRFQLRGEKDSKKIDEAVAQLLADALQAERELVLETVIRACDSEGYIHHSEIRAFAHREQPK